MKRPSGPERPTGPGRAGPVRAERPERAGDILDTFFRRNNISGGKDHVAFYRSWEQIVGFDIASHTSVTDIRNSALLVEVDHPAWMQMVQLRQNQILATVQKRFPRLGVKSLNLRLVERLSAPIATPPVAASTPEAPDAGRDAPPGESPGTATEPGGTASSDGAPPRGDARSPATTTRGDAHGPATTRADADGARHGAEKPSDPTEEPGGASADRLQSALSRLGRAISEREEE